MFSLGGNDSGAMSYDFNGNITSLKRTFNGSVVDNLAYSYPANTNKLSGVTDAGTNPATLNEFFANSSNYGYDANGNLISDTEKGISSITYNYLNLTQTVSKSGQTVNYTYDAGGQKLKANFGVGKVYDYVAGLVYVNDSLDFVATTEGRVLPPGRAVNPEDAVSNSFYRYEYQLKDHLGNLRVSCRCAEKPNSVSPSDAFAPIVVQENHYDPWGLGLPLNQQAEKLGGSPVDRFTYNSKEKQKDLGWLDYGARMYDPAIGRWDGVDALGEVSRRRSTYSYAYNNPIRFIDVDGYFAITPGKTYDETTGELIHDDGLNDDKVYIGTRNDGSDRRLVGIAGNETGQIRDISNLFNAQINDTKSFFKRKGKEFDAQSGYIGGNTTGQIV